MSSSRPDIVLCAPGAGLGHLVRASALGLELTRLGLAVRIVTHSLYAENLTKITGLPTDFIPAARWAARVPAHAAGLSPGLVVLDTFPFGLRGEWSRPPGKLRFAFLARRLKPAAYQAASGAAWDLGSPVLERVIGLEPLSGEYERLLGRGDGVRVDIRGRVRFPSDDFDVPVPGRLEGYLDAGAALVVHSGPDFEIARLAAAARKMGGEPVVLIAPRDRRGGDLPCFNVFPAARLYRAARRIVTGGGYNSAAEAALFPEKHLCLAFERRYDDQAGRLEGPAMNPRGGRAEAAGILADWAGE